MRRVLFLCSGALFVALQNTQHACLLILVYLNLNELRLTRGRRHCDFCIYMAHCYTPELIILVQRGRH